MCEKVCITKTRTTMPLFCSQISDLLASKCFWIFTFCAITCTSPCLLGDFNKPRYVTVTDKFIIIQLTETKRNCLH